MTSPVPRDRGAIAFALLIVVAGASLAASVVAEMTVAAVHAARARTAADAAALAALDGGGADSAARVAGLNGATLASFELHGHVSEVTVRVGRSTARARATDGP